MGESKISFQDVLQLVELIKRSATFSELRIRSGDLEIDLRRGAANALLPSGVSPASVEPPAADVAALSSPAVATPQPPVRSAARPPSPHDGAGVVKAPMVGTIYRAPEPGAAPFVQVGQPVAPGDQLCIIEVMKLMNAVHAESHGTVTEILVEDGEAVEFGQALFVVSPH